jgi:hypothetical protein
MCDGGWANVPPPPPEGFDHGTAKAVGNAKRKQLKDGMASTGLISDVRHEVVTIGMLPLRALKGLMALVTRPFRR